MLLKKVVLLLFDMVGYVFEYPIFNAQCRISKLEAYFEIQHWELMIRYFKRSDRNVSSRKDPSWPDSVVLTSLGTGH
jgi:hypothetical protein